jgi:hypothetical protein
MALIDLGLSGFCHEVHSGIFDDVGAVFADLRCGIQAEKLTVGFVEMGDVAVRIRHHDPVMDAVEDQLVLIQLGFQRKHVK